MYDVGFSSGSIANNNNQIDKILLLYMSSDSSMVYACINDQYLLRLQISRITIICNLSKMKLYNSLLQRYPIPTKCISSGILFSVGDIISQKVFQQKISIDWVRNINFFTMGTVYIAPCLHVWYCKLLPKIATPLFGGFNKTVRVLGSMLLDQLLFAPILLTGFYAFNGVVLQRKIQGFSKGISLAKEKLWETLLANWKIWPIASTINFWFMPVQYQVLFANFVGLFWNIILSFISNKQHPKAPQTPQVSSKTNLVQ